MPRSRATWVAGLPASLRRRAFSIWPHVLVLANLVERWFRELADKALRRGPPSCDPRDTAAVTDILQGIAGTP